MLKLAPYISLANSLVCALGFVLIILVWIAFAGCEYGRKAATAEQPVQEKGAK